MGHEWIQRFGDVRKAFRVWLDYQPYRPMALVDTKQCLKHDFPNWLAAVWHEREAIKNANPPSWGWRNDSGDLAYLTIEQYVSFLKHPLAQDQWFRDKMIIVLTNELDEYASDSIIRQIKTEAGSSGLNAEDIIRRIIWAAGTKMTTCDDQPSLGGVAKLMEVEEAACIKLAFDAEGRPGIKTSIPGFNLSALILDENNEVKTCLIYPARGYEVRNGKLWDKRKKAALDEIVACHPDNAAATSVIKKYRAVQKQELVWDSLSGDYSRGFTEAWDNPAIDTIPGRIQENVDMLHWSMGRLEKPYPMKMSLTKDLFELRHRMILNGILREDQFNF